LSLLTWLGFEGVMNLALTVLQGYLAHKKERPPKTLQ